MVSESNRAHILVIDDDEAMGRLISRILSAQHEVTVEAGARAALLRIEAGGRFDLVLCDVTMPGMSGIELYIHLRSTSPAVAGKVALMTGGGLEPHDEALLVSLGVPRIAKPFSPLDLRAFVKSHLQRPAPPAPRAPPAAAREAPLAAGQARHGCERRLRRAIDAVPHPIVLFDHDLRIRHANPVALRAFGLPLADVMGRASEELWPPELTGRFVPPLRRARETCSLQETETEFPVALEGVRLFLITYVPILDEHGRVDEILGIARDATEGRRAEQALREKLEMSERLAHIAASVPGAIFSYELSPGGKARVPSASSALLDIYGIPLAELASNMDAWRANLPPDELARVTAGIAEAARGPSAWHDVHRYNHPQKGPRWIEVWSLPAAEGDGPVVWHGFVMDVTDRKRAEERIERLSRIYRTRSDANEAIVRATSEAELFQRVCDIVAGLGGLRVTRIAVVDRAQGLLEQVAYAGTPGLVRSIPLDPADPRSVALASEAVRLGTTRVENDLPSRARPGLVPVAGEVGSAICLPLRRGGEVVAVLAIAAREVGYFDDEVVALLDAMAQDISFCLDHLARAEELRESEARYRGLIDNLEEVVYLTGAEARFTFVSGAISRFGYTPKDLVGKPMSTLVHPDDMDKVAATRRELLTGRHMVCEPRLLDATGATRFVRISARPLGEGERVIGTQGVITDLTRQRDIEEQLRMSQKMEAIGQLAGGVAHDFNNLLAVISSYVDLAIEALPPDTPVVADLAEVRHAGQRAAALTRQLLAFSRKQVLQPQVLDLNALVNGTRRMLERLLGEDVELVFLPAPDLGATRADAGQIEQVLVNLAVNARQAMPGGGTLVIATSNVELGAAQASASPCVRPGRYAKISVADTGSGMDAATQARVFEPFFTTKPAGEGTGLGLATVYGIVKQSGGHITIESAPGAGTTFEVFLPRDGDVCPSEKGATSDAPPPAACSPEPEAAPDPGVADCPVSRPGEKGPCGDETILVVEDEAAVRNVARRILTAAGYRVLTAGGAAEALELWSARGGEVRLLLTDVVMPGLNGRELASRLLARRPDLRVLFMSGYTSDAIVHRGVLDPDTAFLAKPFVSNQLLQKVREVLDAA